MSINSKGFIYAILAYLFWGLSPLYFHAIAMANTTEILVNRIVWSFVFMFVLIVLRKRNLNTIIKQKKTIILLTLSSILIAINWSLFIWAVHYGYILEASLGYFINPLVNVLLGVLFLQEKLNRIQWLAIFFTICGILIPLVQLGELPFISLGLAFSFGFYGLLRKKVAVNADTGLFVETFILLPFILFYIGFNFHSFAADLSNNSIHLNVLLMLAGVVTCVPLLFFSAAATKIPLYLLGVLQYIAPSLMFVIALFIFDEAFTLAKGIAFGFIWLALIIFVADLVKKNSQI